MFCPNCGIQLPDKARFCGGCGTAMPDVPQNEVLCFLKEKFVASNFTVATVLLTVGAALGVISGTLPVIEILTVIALWMLISAAKGNKPLTGYTGGLTTARVAVQIQRIFSWIAVGALAVSGVLIAVLGVVAAELIGTEEVFATPEFSYYLGLLGGYDIADIGGALFVIMGIVFVIMAVVTALFNVFMMGSFLKCARSFENSAKIGKLMIDKLESTRGWIIFIGVIECMSAIGVIETVIIGDISSSLFGFAANVCTAVALFMFAASLKSKENVVDNF